MQGDERDSVGDEQLAERARNGDRAAFGELWERHSRAGLTAARQFSSIADPDDIVAESYLRILRAIERGGGPHEAFRPYLYRTIHNVALGWKPRASSVPLDDLDELEDDRTDIETTTLENTITVRAFRTLPERWQTVLWYTEVEGLEPADAAPFLGMTPNAVAALAYRARDGLKKAWLQAHVSDLRVPPECRWTTERMGEYARNSLTPRARKRFEDHLITCTRCSILVEEVDELGSRLAAILLPLVLGGSAAAALLATRGGDAQQPQAEASTVPLASKVSRTLVGAGIAVALVASIGATALAVTGALSPQVVPETTADSPADNRGSSVTLPPRTEPEPAPTPDPPAPQPPSPQPAPPVAPPAPVDADTLAPAVPLVFAPIDGALIADAQPVFSGTGEPGARVEVAHGADGIVVVAATTVLGDGTWSVATTAPVPDGVASFRATQIDPAGNTSVAALVSVTIDTVALAPAVASPGVSPFFFLPDISGTAEPLANIELSDDGGNLIAVATADESGAWLIPLPDPGRDDESITAIQTDPAGNRSAASAAIGPLVFARPTLMSPVEGGTVASTAGSTAVTVQISGVEGMQVQILIDGTPTGNIHTLEVLPIVRITPALADGEHTIGVRYYETTTARVGSTSRVTFVIG